MTSKGGPDLDLSPLRAALSSTYWISPQIILWWEPEGGSLVAKCPESALTSFSWQLRRQLIYTLPPISFEGEKKT